MYAPATHSFRTPAVHRRSSQRVRRARTLRILFLMVVAVAVLVVAPRAVYMMGHTEAPATVKHSVGHGDTLWAIASQYSEGQDVRKVIYAIKQANGMKTPTVQPGQVLIIPQVGS